MSPSASPSASPSESPSASPSEPPWGDIRYWVGNGTNTDWFERSNWKDDVVGISGAPVPTMYNEVYFGDFGVGNCSLIDNVECKRFIMDTEGYAPIIDDEARTGAFDCSFWNVTVYGDIQVYSTVSPNRQRIFNPETWTLASSGTFAWLQCNNPIVRAVVSEGITVDNSSVPANCRYLVANNIIFMANSIITSTVPTYFVVRWPMAFNAFEIDSTVTLGSNVNLLFYPENDTEYQQQGFVTAGDVVITGQNVFDAPMDVFGRSSMVSMTSNLTCKMLLVCGGDESTTEGTATTFNTDVSDLVATDVILGYSDVSTPGQYQGKIRFGTGSHVITNLQGAGEYSFGYIAFEYSSIAVAGDIDMRYLATAEIESIITLVGSGTQLLYFGGSETSPNGFGDLVVDKPNGRATMQDIWYVANFIGVRGDFDLNGFVMKVGY